MPNLLMLTRRKHKSSSVKLKGGLSLPDDTYGDGSVKLILSAQRQAACAKLFRADTVGKNEEIMSVFINPEQSTVLYFSAGTYVLKLAYGSEWLGDEEAFGPSGSYSATQPYTFEAGGSYKLESSSAGGDFYTDSQSGFTGS